MYQAQCVPPWLTIYHLPLPSDHAAASRGAAGLHCWAEWGGFYTGHSFHEIMRCRSAIHDRYQNIFKEKNGLGDNLYLSFLDIKISRDQPLQHSTIWIQFCSCRLYRESKKVSYWKNGHITTFKLIQKAKAGVVLEFRIFATI